MRQYKKIYPIGTNSCEECKYHKNPIQTGCGYVNFDCKLIGNKNVPCLNIFPKWCPLENGDIK